MKIPVLLRVRRPLSIRGTPAGMGMRTDRGGYSMRSLRVFLEDCDCSLPFGFDCRASTSHNVFLVPVLCAVPIQSSYKYQLQFPYMSRFQQSMAHTTFLGSPSIVEMAFFCDLSWRNGLALFNRVLHARFLPPPLQTPHLASVNHKSKTSDKTPFPKDRSNHPTTLKMVLPKLVGIDTMRRNSSCYNYLHTV